MTWNRPSNLIFPWIEKLSARLSKEDLPVFDGETLWISSDYRFSDPTVDFDTIGILISNPDASDDWNRLRTQVRAQLLGERRMAWKRLNDRRRQEAFFPFLSAANTLQGLCVAVAIERIPEFRFTTRELIGQYRGRDWLSADWKTETAEQLFRITYFTAFFVAGLSKPGQDIIWISDQDPVFANEVFHRDTGTLFTKFLNAFTRHGFGQISIGTTAITESDLLEEDLAAIPDLLCGASAMMLTSAKRKFGQIPRIPIDLDRQDDRTSNFLHWFADTSNPLKRHMCVIEQRADGELSADIVRVEP